jgi:threonyl-tRNA synthetase
MEYVAEDGSRQQPIMIHRALLGSIERFFGVLIEHYSGNFPLWLAPEQIRVLPITDSANNYCQKLVQRFENEGLRAGADISGEKIGKKIRDAESMKVPYMAVIGKKETEEGTISLRKHTVGDLGAMTLDEAIEKLNSEVENKS